MKQYTSEDIDEIVTYLLDRDDSCSMELIVRELREYVQKGEMSLWKDECAVGKVLFDFFVKDRLFNNLTNIATIDELVAKLLSEVRRTLELNGNQKIEKTVGQYLLARYPWKTKSICLY